MKIKLIKGWGGRRVSLEMEVEVGDWREVMIDIEETGAVM